MCQPRWCCSSRAPAATWVRSLRPAVLLLLLLLQAWGSSPAVMCPSCGCTAAAREAPARAPAPCAPTCRLNTTTTTAASPPPAVGTVNKIGDDHIGLLVYGVFNAVIGADHIRGDFKCSMQVGRALGGWASRGPRSRCGAACCLRVAAS